jgi:Rod binding domain-containing protein
MIDGLSAYGSTGASTPVTSGAGLDATQKQNLKTTCNEFESIFWKSMLDATNFGDTSSSSTDDSTDDSTISDASSFYTDTMRSQVSDALAKTGSLGIGDELYRWMIDAYGG